MVTTGAITNRIDKLEARGLVVRTTGRDRRQVIVRLTAAGRELVDEIVQSHMATEHDLLGALSDRQRTELANALRTVLLSVGDRAE